MTNPKERTEVKVRQEQAVLAAVYLPGDHVDDHDPLGELRELAQTAGATVVGEILQRRARPEAGTFMGKGKLEELRGMCEATDAGLVIFDHELSPRQIANIEKMLERKVLDRSELILDIFAGRATTHAAKLQVELAQLQYTYPRLRAMWDHLERIVGTGGIGGIGTRGPGETQLETDRRIVQRRQSQLRRDLEVIQARKSREVRRRNVDNVTLGLVGYTNAGKSTLFNTLTAGGAHASDQLFATLMTRTREWDLGKGFRVMLSDTVGFVRDLPHHLIATFRATLEEATHADLLLIVLDVSDPSAELHYQTVQRSLDEIEASAREAEARAGFEYRSPERIVLLNKADRLPDQSQILAWLQREPEAIPFCALREDAEGHDELRERVKLAALGEVQELLITLPIENARSIAEVEHRGEVLDREYLNGKVRLKARIGSKQADQLRAGGAVVEAVE